MDTIPGQPAPSNGDPGPASLPAQKPPPDAGGRSTRVPALDVVRGVALLGILLLNIVDFAWPSQAYDSVATLFYTTDSIGEVPDPDAERDAAKKKQDDWKTLADGKPALDSAFPSGRVAIAAVSSVWDVAEWAVVRVFFANKMRTLFCILFGAGLVHLAARVAERGQPPLWLHYRRMLLLLLIGLVHGALIWEGDILFGYAATGLYLYPFLRLGAKTLARVSIGLFLLLPLLLVVGLGAYGIVTTRGPVLEARVIAAAGRTLATAPEAVPDAAADGPLATDRPATEAPPDVDGPDRDEGDVEENAPTPLEARGAARKAAVEALGFVDRLILRGHRSLARRDDSQRPERLSRSIRLHRDGTWWAQVKARVKQERWMWLGMLSPLSLIALGWLMILGMSLAKDGFFAGEWPVDRYRLLAFRVVPAGWILEALFLLLRQRLGRDGIVWLAVLVPVEQAVIPLISLGYAAGVILVLRSGRWRPVTDRLAAVGRMALSNYLAQSLICTLLFYSFGLRLFGSLPRVWLLAVVAGVWAVELWWSPIWLARHPFGPVEWCWRSLASMERLPWRRTGAPG